MDTDLVIDLRGPALLAVLASDLAYAVLCAVERDHGPKLRAVLRADLVSIAALAAAGVLLVA